MDRHTPEQRHKNMSAIRNKDTKIEVMVRKYLYSKGFRYRKNHKGLLGIPDIAFPGLKTVVFIHGCFWHGHTNCRYAVIPKTQTAFWVAKISRNRERDQEVLDEYHKMGWIVITIMECELKPKVRLETLNALVARLLEIKQNKNSKQTL